MTASAATPTKYGGGSLPHYTPAPGLSIAKTKDYENIAVQSIWPQKQDLSSERYSSLPHRHLRFATYGPQCGWPYFGVSICLGLAARRLLHR